MSEKDSNPIADRLIKDCSVCHFSDRSSDNPYCNILRLNVRDIAKFFCCPKTIKASEVAAECINYRNGLCHIFGDKTIKCWVKTDFDLGRDKHFGLRRALLDSNYLEGRA